MPDDIDSPLLARIRESVIGDDQVMHGPYAPRRDEHPQCHKDAVFLSPHKFIGGPGTPGVLVVRRELLTNRVPVVPGGGTVAYVNPLEHRYLEDPAHREEGGTPAIVESIRAGLVSDDFEHLRWFELPAACLRP